MGRAHLDDVVGSGDFESLNTSEDERGNSEGLGSEHVALLSCERIDRGVKVLLRGCLSTSVRGNDCVLRRGLSRCQ